jgi:hypothetical protein
MGPGCRSKASKFFNAEKQEGRRRGHREGQYWRFAQYSIRLCAMRQNPSSPRPLRLAFLLLRVEKPASLIANVARLQTFGVGTSVHRP